VAQFIWKIISDIIERTVGEDFESIGRLWSSEKKI
jgi:hypothetical protein